MIKTNLTLKTIKNIIAIFKINDGNYKTNKIKL